MPMQWLTELWAWCRGLPPDMMFLFALPFIVAAAGLFAERLRRQ